MIPKINGSTSIGRGNFMLSETIRYDGADKLFQAWQERQRGLPKRHTVDPVVIRAVHAAMEEEAYCLDVTPDVVTVTASSDAGFIWGLTTLYLLLREGDGVCPCQRICDKPSYHHRGVHLDCSRHFFSVETTKLLIELASLCKMNRLHWHISDDQGYRLESKAFPELNRIGSWRTELDGSTYGGYYTAEEVSDIVSYARLRGMEIIPEIDLPGHVTAILAAYPDLSCSGTALKVPVMAGIHQQILCAGKEAVLAFVCRLLDEVTAMFPYEYFHIGGDEAPKAEWQKCPHCQEKIRMLGLANEEELQRHFTVEVAAHLAALKKKAICWNDSLKSANLPEEICVQYWDDTGADLEDCSRDLENHSRKWIYSFTPQFYFDYAPCLAPMRKVWNYKPVFRNGVGIPEDRLLGIECALWTERISTQEELLSRAFPRMYVVAELGWNKHSRDPHNADCYKDFLTRCEKMRALAQQEGIILPSVEEGDPSGQKQMDLILDDWKPSIQSAREHGAERMIPIIVRLVQSKINDQFSEDEIKRLIEELLS